VHQLWQLLYAVPHVAMMTNIRVPSNTDPTVADFFQPCLTPPFLCFLISQPLRLLTYANSSASRTRCRLLPLSALHSLRSIHITACHHLPCIHFMFAGTLESA
jgi:hypothetical protein